MYEIYRDAPDKYITTTPDKNKDKISNNLYEPEQEVSPQNSPELPLENTFEPLQTQNFSEIPQKTASTQKLTLIDEDIINHLTINKETDIPMLLLSTNLTLKSKRHMYYFPMDFEKLTLDGLIDTGALTRAISEQDLNKIKLLAPEAITDTGPAPNFQIMVANGQLETPIGTVCLTFEVADFMFKENFIIMKVLPNPLIGLCFLKKNNAIFDIRQGVLTFPHLSMQIKPEHNLQIRQSTPLLAGATYTLQPGETLLIAIRMPHLIDHDATGIVTPSTHLEDHDTLFLVFFLCTVNNNAVGYQICNFSELPYTIKTDTHLADFRVLSPEQLKFIKPINPSMLTFIMHQHTEVTDVYLKQLLKVNNEEDTTEQYWFPTPEQPGGPTTYTPIQKRIFDELVELQTIEKLNPQDDEQSRKTFLDKFDWSDTTLTLFERQKVEELLVEFHDIFARHRFDIGTNREFKVKPTPNDDRPAYSQSLPTPINLKDDITVELALLHKYGIITTLPFSKYASPIFAQRKPNGRLRLLVDLRKINNLISEDYVNNNHPVSTLSDAAQHMAGKKLFCKLDCSQA